MVNPIGAIEESITQGERKGGKGEDDVVEGETILV
jgi:hypothetical protein